MFVLFAQASFRFANVTHADFRSVVIGEHKPLLHPSAVSALAVWRNFIVTGGQDGVIRVWNADTGKVLSAVVAAPIDLCVSGGAGTAWTHWLSERPRHIDGWQDNCVRQWQALLLCGMRHDCARVDRHHWRDYK